MKPDILMKVIFTFIYRKVTKVMENYLPISRKLVYNLYWVKVKPLHCIFSDSICRAYKD